MWTADGQSKAHCYAPVEEQHETEEDEHLSGQMGTRRATRNESRRGRTPERTNGNPPCSTQRTSKRTDTRDHKWEPAMQHDKRNRQAKPKSRAAYSDASHLHVPQARCKQQKQTQALAPCSEHGAQHAKQRIPRHTYHCARRVHGRSAGDDDTRLFHKPVWLNTTSLMQHTSLLRRRHEYGGCRRQSTMGKCVRRSPG